MTAQTKKAVLTALAGLVLSIGAPTSAHALVTLTLPTTTFDALGPQQYDEGTVFSADLLNQVQAAGFLPGNTSEFLPATGTGTLGVIVYSNNAVANSAPFAQPMNSLNSGDFDGTWGAANGDTVGALRSLLTVGGINYQPLFIFDHNENAQSPNLQITGEFSIFRGTTALASFSLDTLANGTYDPASYVLSCGSPSVGPAAPTPYGPCSIPAATDSGTTYEWTTVGSGHPDYYAIFNTLNLYDGNFLDSDRIVVTMSIRGNDSGFEELAIGGYRFTTPNQDVPEPGSLAMLGLSLGLLAAITRRRGRRSST